MCCIAPQKYHFTEKRDELFLPYFKEEKQLVYCDNVPSRRIGHPIIQPRRVVNFFGQLQAQPQVCAFTQRK